MKQKLREEIDIKDTWDLTYIFKNDNEFYQVLNEAEKEIENISNFKGKLLNSSDDLLKYLEYSDNIERKLYKLYYYAHLNLDTDTTNTVSQEKEGKVSKLMQKYEILSSFVLPELLKSDYE